MTQGPIPTVRRIIGAGGGITRRQRTSDPSDRSRGPHRHIGSGLPSADRLAPLGCSQGSMRAIEAGGLGDRPGVAAMLMRALEGALALKPGLVVERQVKLLLRLVEDLAATAHHDPGGLEDLVEGEARCDPAIKYRGE